MQWLIVSILGTPDDNTWPGVTSFPDYKSSFPKWVRDYYKPIVEGMTPEGLELLEALLVYDPAGRMSAKAACNHRYFEKGSSFHAARLNGEEY
jgi:cyclin-dependent kinase